jgi:putative aldouronate transport system substrate-binding protein
MLNRETENVAGAMEFLDWMLADGWEPLTYGFEGEHVEYVDGEIPRRTISNDQYDKVLRYAFQYVLLDQRQVQPEWLPTMWPQDDVSQRWADITTQALEVSMQGDFRRDFPTQPSDEEIGRFMAEFEPIFQEVRTNTIIGGDEHTPEAAVERLRNEWERLGGDEITEIYQQYYEENFAD